MAENLKTTTYRDGTAIPSGLNDDMWFNTTNGAYTILPFRGKGVTSEKEMVEAYGVLYNWYAVEDSRGLCPEGWAVPTDSQWIELTDYVSNGFGMESPTGNQLKSTRQIDRRLQRDYITDEHPRWNSDDFNWHEGSDEFGFRALPGGMRPAPFFPTGGRVGIDGRWWTSTVVKLEYRQNHAYSRSMSYFDGGVSRNDNISKYYVINSRT